jgi:hypothetical protein
MCYFDHFKPGANILDTLGADFDAGRQLAFFQTIVTAVTLVHDAIACILWEKIKVEPDSRLALGNVPGTYGLALGAPHAHIRMNAHDAVELGEGSTERTQVGARGIAAVHAAPRNVNFKILAIVFAIGFLNKQPVVRR